MGPLGTVRLPGIHAINDPRDYVHERLAEAVELFNAETLPDERVRLYHEIQQLRSHWIGARETATFGRANGRGLWGAYEEDLAVGAAFESEGAP